MKFTVAENGDGVLEGESKPLPTIWGAL